MKNGRSRLQGVSNIVRFNFPMYLLAVVAIVLALTLMRFTHGPLRIVLALGAGIALLQLSVSLVASAYAYDKSGLYDLKFLPASLPPGARILNISAGFDECSKLIAQVFPDATLQAYDFYDPARHTESSIRRAREAYPPVPGTRVVATGKFPEEARSADLICVILAAHEIRDNRERQLFFSEMKRILKADGELIVVEHLRNRANYFAYSIGAFHFFPGSRWTADFGAAGLRISKSYPLNPFIHCYSLSSGNAVTS